MDLKRAILGFRFGLSKRITMNEKITAFLEANIDLVRSLQTIRDRYAQRKDFRAAIMSDWIATLEEGKKFADSLAPWVPPGELMLIEAGERGGSLVTGLKEAVVLSSAASKNKTAIIAGVAFPIVLFMMLGGMLIMFQLQMVPVFENLLPIPEWPASAQTLYNISYFVHNQMWLLIISIIGLSILIGKTMGTWTRKPRHIFDKLPPWNVYRSYQSSSFLIALSSLMRAGVPAYDALRTMSKNASPWMKAHLDKMMATMSLGGGNMGRALDTGLLDDETAGDVQDYSRLGSFSDAIYILGGRSLEKGIKNIQDRMSIIKNLLLVMVAGSIIWIYFASFGLQTNIADGMNKVRSQASVTTSQNINDTHTTRLS